MNQKSFDLRMQELRLQYVKESHEIERQRDEIERHKTFQVNADEKDFYEYKKIMTKKINDAKAERANIDPDDQQGRDIMSALISRCHSEVDDRYRKMIIDQNAAAEEAWNELRELDSKARKLKEWYETERLNAMQELAESMEEVSNEKDNV